jgi:phosphoribosylformylglycinamidine synthase PurS subunit
MPEPIHYIEVRKKTGLPDGRANALLESVRDLGIEGIRGFQVGNLYLLQGVLEASTLERICKDLLCDSIAEEAFIGQNRLPGFEGSLTAKVTYHPGVTDAAADTVLEALHLLSVESVKKVSTGKVYRLETESAMTQDAIETVCERVLANPVIQHYEVFDNAGRLILKG